MVVTIEEFKNNVDIYLQLALKEDVYITDENNKPRYRLTNHLKEIAESLIGSLPKEATIEDGKNERLKRHLL